jgi:hypothetical protein
VTEQNEGIHGARSLLNGASWRNRICRYASKRIMNIARLFALALVLVSAKAAAQAATTPVRKSPDCPHGRGSAISEIACDIALGLGTIDSGPLVVSAPLESDSEIKNAARLTARLTRVVAGRLSGAARAHEKPAPFARAQALSQRYKRLIHLVPVLAHGKLSVTADLYAAERGFWERVRDPRPPPLAHAFAERALDPEIRSFMPKVPLIARHVDEVPLFDRPVVALACGDVGADANADIVMMTRRRVAYGRVKGGKLVLHVDRNWHDLSPVAGSPLREPLATSVITGDGSVIVGSSDRARALRLDAWGRPIQDTEQRLLWPSGGCSKLEERAISSRVEPCLGFSAPAKTALAGSFDAVAGAALIGTSGKLRVVQAGRLANQNAVLLTDESGRSARVEGLGAQIAVGDLDGDGQPELVASADTLEPKHDRLTAYTWLDDGRLVERFKLPMSRGVHALAICPAASGSMAPIVAASAQALVILR